MFNDNVIEPEVRIVSGIYGVQAISILSVGVAFIYYCKRDHSEFYVKYKSKIITAVVLMIVPLALRCLFDFLMTTKFVNIVNRSITTVTSYNLCFFLMTTYLVVISQVSSFVFSFLRSRIKKEGNRVRQRLQASLGQRVNTSGGVEEDQPASIPEESTSSDEIVSIFDPPI